jgi:hypothetical protein
MIIVKEIIPTVGLTDISDPDIFAVRLLGVARTGIGQVRISTVGPPPVAGSREFAYAGSSLQFDLTNPFGPGELVNVLYEI